MNWGYTLTMIVAVVTCSALLKRSQKSLAMPDWQKLAIGMAAFCGAMLGAKLPFVLHDWQGLWSGTAWFSHGKTILCGIVGGYLAVEYVKWAFRIEVKTGDTFAIPVAVAVAIGRVGCFVGGCCYGTPTELPWGVHFPRVDTQHVLRHPTQLYEFTFHSLAALTLLWLKRHGKFRGQSLKLYIIAYLFYRFASELIRPEARYWLGLTGYQLATLVLIPLFAWLWIRDARVLPHQDRLADG